MSRIVGYPPDDYVTPPFPSLYWPPQRQQLDGSLYFLSDIWRFTVYWTIAIFAIVHLICAGIALAMQIGKKQANWLYLGAVPIVYCVVAGIEALFAGTIVGLVVGAVYNAGYFWMSTWIPFIWGWISVLVLIISSFSIQGGL